MSTDTSQRPTFWFTGLSKSGKSTLATGLAEYLRDRAVRTELIDGTAIRDELGQSIGYSREERVKMNRILCTIARKLARNNVTPIVTAITPYQESRDYNRSELSQYIEIYLSCSIEDCMLRDSQGLYRRALRGDLTHFIGVDDPYEIPKVPDLIVPTGSEDVTQSLARVIQCARLHLPSLR